MKVLVVVSMLAVAAVVAPGAHAGTYSVWSCRGPDGGPAPAGAWSATGSAPGDVLFGDTCAQGGALSVALAPGRPFERTDEGLSAFVAPPGTRIDSYELWRSLTVATSTPDYVAEVVERADGVTLGAYGCATSGPVCPPAGDPLSPLNRVAEHDRPLDAVALRVGCRIDACDASATAPARAELYRSHVVLDDPEPPAARRLSGTLTGPDAVTGAGTLIVAATDRGGGIAAVSLSIDGGPERVAASFSDTCEPPYSAAQPCPTEAERAFSVDTSALADGAHTASGAVVDAAGNTTPWGPLTFTVHQPPPAGHDRDRPPPVVHDRDRPPPITVEPAPDNGRPAVQVPRLRLARSVVEHAPGSAATLAGTLRTAGGAPVAGARLTLGSRDMGTDADDERSTTITTDARGAFSVRLRRDGAQRVTVSFAPRPGAAPTATASATVRTRLALRAKPSRRRLPEGVTLTLRGRLRGAGASASGALVEIHSIVRGRWRPVGEVRVDADGTYRWRYRFVRLTRDTVFSFRTVVPRLPGWPWASTHSPTVRVRVDA